MNSEYYRISRASRGNGGACLSVCMLIYKFINTDKKVDVMHRRFDNLKDQIVAGMEETKDEIQELNKDLLRQFRNGG